MITRSWIWGGVALLALVVGLGALQYAHAATATGKKPVNFTLTTVNNKKISLSDYRGKVVVVDMWATWCGYCVREIPGLVALQREATAAKQPLQIIGVSVDADRDDVRQFVAANKINYPIAYNDEKAMRPFGEVYGLPTKFIIDKQGVLVDKIIGAVEKDVLQKRLAPYLK
ncbi:MAG TPA: TlpA disulfide reductase family protein [Armatimonadota bacterium]|jgi:thiol-disulfide isomerase/thioredoxin